MDNNKKNPDDFVNSSNSSDKEKDLDNMELIEKFNLEIITDPKIIAELDKQPLYIPPHETPDTYDRKALAEDIFKKSEKVIGQYNPILVAVWEEDPEKDSTVSWHRIHLRVINGRHRYAQDPNWMRQYVRVTSVRQYWILRLHTDLKKADNPNEKAMMFREIADYVLKNTNCQRTDVGKIICKMFPQFSPQRILPYLTSDMKDPIKALNRLGKTRKKTLAEIIQEPSKDPKDEKIKQLEKEIVGYLEENSYYKELAIQKENLVGIYESRFRILENVEQEVEVEQIGKIKIKLEKNGTRFIVTV